MVRWRRRADFGVDGITEVDIGEGHGQGVLVEATTASGVRRSGRGPLARHFDGGLDDSRRS